MHVSLGLLIAAGILCSAVMTYRSFNVGINDFKLEFNPSWANLTQTRTNGSSIDVRQDFDLLLINDVTNNLLVNFRIDKLENGGYKPTFINFKREACQVMKNKNPIFDTIADSLKKLGVLPNRCPVKKGCYYIRNFRFNEEWFPGFVPHKFLRTELNITHKLKNVEIFLLYIRWDLEVVKK